MHPRWHRVTALLSRRERDVAATLHALDDLVRVLRGQVAGYVSAQRLRDRTVYDDTGQVDPAQRLQVAVAQLDEVTRAKRASAIQE
jgi:hypothetical protein